MRIPKSTWFSLRPAFLALLLLNCLHMDYSSCEEEGGDGNAAAVGVCGVGVCAREERGTVCDEAFPRQHF